MTTSSTQPIAAADARPALSMRQRTQSPNLRAYAALALGVICIGFSAIFTKWANPAGSLQVTGAVSAFWRVAIATLALSIPYGLYLASNRYKAQGAARDAALAVEHGEEVEPKGQATWSAGLVWGTILAGLFFALDLGVWNTSLLFTSAANATLLGNLSTLWVSLGALLLFHESLKRRFWLGMVIALVGVAIVVGRDFIEHPTLTWGDILAVLSSVFYAAYILATNRVRRGLGTMHFMWINSAAATVLLFAYVLIAGETLWGFSAEQWWALAALGIVAHAIGWMAINYALGHLPAPLTSVSLLSQPVITAIIAVPLLGEGLAINQIVGGLLVLVGIYIVNRK